MAKRTMCDVCDKEIQDGENVGLRNPIFNHEFHKIKDAHTSESVQVEVRITSKINGKADSDLCLSCLKTAVAKA